MERIDNLLPGGGKGTSGSSGSRKRPEAAALRLDDQICPHCGREIESEWNEFPPAIQRKYDKPGEWYYHPCTPECEMKNDQREWERMRRDSRIETLQARSGLSKRLKSYTFDNFDPLINESTRKASSKIGDYQMNWKENREAGRGLYLCGGVGTGKTHLAVALLNELIRKSRVPSLFVTVPELLDNLRGTYDNPGRNLDEWMDAVKNAEFLVLDDLGSEKPTPWVQERIFVIVNHRYRESLPTVFTSNIGPMDLAAQLGERTASRIIAMCGRGIELQGTDHREMEARKSV
ncbi:MAG: ATP-binding protein [Actinomycetota bacterium]|nr:ATP-binding protein [Actinomycetota bacterium]